MTEAISKNYLSKVKDRSTGEETYFKDEDAREQLNNIANQFTHEQTENLYKLKYKGTVIASIPIGSNVEVTSYTITNNLTYCSNNNTNTEIIEGNSYVANITPNAGYELNSVSVSMGGIDITSSCYSNGQINISSVTGDIVITAIATIIVVPSIEPVLVWNFENETAGNGYGAITMSVGKSEDEGDYTIKYADDTGALSSYDKICTLSPRVDNPSSYSCFNAFQLIPSSATKLIAVKDNNIKAEFLIPTNKKFANGNYGQHLYSFGAISDVHLSVDTAESDFATALTYLNNNENVAFTCISGDLTNNGTESEFTTYKNLVTANSSNTPVYATNGNHDLFNSFSDELWNKYVNNTRDYLFKYKNDVFIFLALNTTTEPNDAFTSEQMSWVETQLEKYSTARIFMFTHCFINGTQNGNINDAYKSYILTTTNKCGMWLINLMKQYKNVSLFTGHSHIKFIAQELESKVTVCNNIDNTEIGYLLHIPSITVPRGVTNGSIDFSGLYAESEGVIVDVYENCILYRGRNFVDKKFIPIGQFVLPYIQGSLPEPAIYTVTNTLSNVTNSNNSTEVTEGESYTATITINTGYELSNVIVTMNGEDITSTAYSNGIISIENITGDITITATATIIDIACTGISLNNTQLTFTNKTSQTLTATVTPSNTTQNITWESSDTTVATVSNGVITIVGEGNCTITVRCGSQSATCTITVEFAKVSITWKDNTKLDRSTGAESTNNLYFASDFIELSDYTYILSSSDRSYTYSVAAYLYDSNKNFIQEDDVNVKTTETPSVYSVNISDYLNSNNLKENTKYIRLRGYTNGNHSDVMNSITLVYF